MLGNNTLTDVYDVIIVGGGIVGCACADECARAGMKVLLFERDVIGGGTTAAGMGHIVVLDDSETQFQFCALSRRLWTERAMEHAEQLEWEKRGTLWVAADEEEMQIVRDKHAYYAERNVRTKILDAGEVAGAEPALRDDLAGGLLVMDDAVLYPPAAAKWLADCAAARGATIRESTQVRRIDPDGSVVLNDNTRFSAGMVINAAGSWSPVLTEGIQLFIRKGHLVVTDRYPDYIRHQIIELGYLKSAHTMTADSVAFNVQPRKDRKILIGSSRQSHTGDADVDYEILGRMLRRAFEYIPGLRQLQAMRCWTGFRPATPDKLPLIGPSPNAGKIWLAAGHEGLGITTSLATARLIVDMLLQRTSDIPVEPFLPTRQMAGETLNG